MKTLISIVFGPSLSSDGSNILESFRSDIIPRIGEEIMTEKSGRYTVKNILTRYQDSNVLVLVYV
jgi:hypothetical protein